MSLFTNSSYKLTVDQVLTKKTPILNLASFVWQFIGTKSENRTAMQCSVIQSIACPSLSAPQSLRETAKTGLTLA